MKYFRRKDTLILLGVILLGFILRILFLPQGGITFGYDQARDAYNSLEIASGSPKIQGPSASTPGLFHGVLYYYLIAPSYLLGEGDPLVTNIWLSIINLLTIIPIYFLGCILFSKRVGLLAAFLFAISFDAVQYANWMSNPAPAVFTNAIFYLGLALMVFQKRILLGGILAALGWGLSTQFEIFLGYLFVPLIIILSSFKIHPTIKQLAIFAGVFILSVSTMILSYFKFGLTFLNGFSQLAGGGDPFGAWREFAPTLALYINRFGEYFYRGLLPFNVAIGGVFGCLVVGMIIYWARTDTKVSKQLKFLLILLFSHAFLIPFGGNSTPFINAGMQAVVFILVSFFIIRLFKSQRWLMISLMLLITFASLNAIFKYNPHGQTVFAIQRAMNLKNQKALIDYTYRSSNNQPFSINTVTSPLWINTTWDYLYNWYGKQKYGSVPSFRGRDQVGQLAYLPKTQGVVDHYYLIIEQPAGIPMQFVQETIDYENSFSKVIEEKDFNGLVVQKRELINELSANKP